jgi:hypothetical protein
MPPKDEPSMEWMHITQTVEEELTLECSIREIEDCENIDVLSQLCVAMARQQWHQGKLLKQAIGQISLLEAVLSGGEQRP